ncbi:ABC transporter substrate-binding protein [Mesorhizobium sp.]|uniref:ABC transporter substrate-binding protein n=1 Tax=Mesorhizobium sp. TaxID=1871066 RepID=UPI000FE7E7D1|nr:ABC transporter substrate-binding protein [Mesorhizobium sp.]RWA76107.1 MAG: peptide ABC transporter substrate-binding protein [Mesorhizobium sp.]TIS47440.1 MAG: peptide ABC transporter substrate-binding protein [Mesorhizobium sp.]
MVKDKLSRRMFLASSAMVGGSTLCGLPLFAKDASAQAAKLTVRTGRDIGNLDPGYMVGGAPDNEIQYAVLPVLLELTISEGVYGWKPSVYVEKFEQRDPTHYEFTLKPGFTWTNGYGEFTADDVKYSYERIKTTDWSGSFKALDHVEVTGKYSGTLVLSQPFAPFTVPGLTCGPVAILCKAAMLTVGEKFTTEFPATCGPYLFEWTPKQKLSLRPNPEWKGPKPAFAEVDALIISEPSAAELAFEAGAVAVTRITASTYARYKDNPPANSEVHVADALTSMWLGMNTEHPKLSDIRVRKAIQHTVDAEQIIQGAYGGAAEKSNGVIPPGLIGHRKETKYSYDPEKARALLAEAGVNGLELELKTLNEQERVLAAQIIQSQLGAVGITVKVIPLDEGPFWEMGDDKKGDPKNLQMWLMWWGTYPDPQQATQWFTSDQVGRWNWERWKSDEYDALYKQGMAESDPQKRESIYLRMQEIMEDTGAYVWIDHELEVFVHRKNIKLNVVPDGMLFRSFGTD